MPFYVAPPADVVAIYCAIAAKHNAEPDPATRYGLRMAGHVICQWLQERHGSTTAGMLVSAGDNALPDLDRPACGGFYLDLP